jgi:hypothetical protein
MKKFLVIGRAEELWMFKCIAAKSCGEGSVYLGCDSVSLGVQFHTLKKEVVWSWGVSVTMYPVMQCHIPEEFSTTLLQELCLSGYS